MKTLLISEIFPPKIGGSGRWFWELYRRFPRDDFTILAGADEKQDEFDHTHDLRLHRMPLTWPTWGILQPRAFSHYRQALRTVRSLVRAERIERIHCGRCLPEGWIAWMVKQLDGLPYACYVHGDEVSRGASAESPGLLSSRQLRWMTWLVLRSANHVVANSRNTARIMQQEWAFPAEKIQLLHPGVDTTYFVPRSCDSKGRDELGWGVRPILLTVARLEKRKGHDMVIRALSAIGKTFPNVLYVIIGDGDERPRLEALTVQLGMTPHVCFMGAVDDQVLRSCYQHCDLFLLPNRQIGTNVEGFGLVLLEAQACGVPVVAGASGGTAETMHVPETGRVVPCEHPQALAHTVTELLGNPPLRAQMGRAARQWVARRFDWQPLTQQATQLFNRT